MKIQHAILGTCLAGLLSACGGGGDSAPVAAAPSFPLKSAYSALVASAFTKNFTVSGTCGGTASLAKAAAVAGASFEGVAGRLSEVGTVTFNLTGCAVPSGASTTTNYYDTNFTSLGSSSASSYDVAVAPVSLPASVLIGDTGTVGTFTSYTSSAKTASTGKDVLSYVVEADPASSASPASTAIVNLVTKSFDAANVLTSTGQDRYRIAATGALVPVSLDIQGANGSSVRLIFQ